MKFYYDKEKSMELMKRIEDKFGERARKTARGKEMHVSDLTGCQLRPYCRIVGIERQTTKQQVGVMVFGIVAENVLGWTYPEDVLQYQANLDMVEKDENIFGHLDVYENYRTPLEVKASRKVIFKANQVPKYWVEQLMSYMSMMGANIGWLVLFNVFSTQIMAFKMVLNNEEIIDWLIVLINRAMKIRNATDVKDPHCLEINPKQYSWCDYKHTCPRRDECKERHIDMKKSSRKKTKK